MVHKNNIKDYLHPALNEKEILSYFNYFITKGFWENSIDFHLNNELLIKDLKTAEKEEDPDILEGLKLSWLFQNNKKEYHSIIESYKISSKPRCFHSPDYTIVNRISFLISLLFITACYYLDPRFKIKEICFLKLYTTHYQKPHSLDQRFIQTFLDFCAKNEKDLKISTSLFLEILVLSPFCRYFLYEKSLFSGNKEFEIVLRIDLKRDSNILKNNLNKVDLINFVPISELMPDKDFIDYVNKLHTNKWKRLK